MTQKIKSREELRQVLGDRGFRSVNEFLLAKAIMNYAETGDNVMMHSIGVMLDGKRKYITVTTRVYVLPPGTGALRILDIMISDEERPPEVEEKIRELTEKIKHGGLIDWYLYTL